MQMMIYCQVQYLSHVIVEIRLPQHKQGCVSDIRLFPNILPSFFKLLEIIGPIKSLTEPLKH